MKRVLAAFFCLFAIYAGILLRMSRLMFAAVPAAQSASGRLVEIAQLRGTIFDCRLQPLTNDGVARCIAVKPTMLALPLLQELLPPTAYETVAARLSAGLPVVVTVDAPAEGGDAVVNAAYPVRYGSRTAVHIIGHLDAEGHGAAGIEKACDALLTETGGTAAARFMTDAQGKVLLGEPIEISGTQIPAGGVVLTLDREIQQIVEEVLDGSGYACTAAVALEIGSGAIRACVSRPAFDPNDVAAGLNGKNAPFVNRAFSAFAVGSVFKPAVAAAALMHGLGDFTWTCTGSITVGGVTFHCPKAEGHGEMQLSSALAHSCNTYFIALGQRLGKTAVRETAALLGFGASAPLADGYTPAAGNLPDLSALDSPAALANLSFGQGTLTATPLQICAMTATLAQGGVRVDPYLIVGTRARDGTVTPAPRPIAKSVLSADAAATICAALRQVVTDGSARRAQSETIAIAGKTATAQTGRTRAGEEIYNAWFTGFFPADAPRYAVTVLVEDGGEGAVSCAPLVREIAERITALESGGAPAG
ncbi:MAG: penicillin-binding protein 2 [Clostridia bacterium]|nr:penicillin-binding protein 2 [Clostridia bacterium]